jgi:hypothetical protein
VGRIGGVVALLSLISSFIHWGHARCPKDWKVNQWHHIITKHDKNTCKIMNNTFIKKSDK